MKKWLKLSMELGKIRITFAVTLSTLTGYILFLGGLDFQAILPVLGVFLLAVSSAALNQLQESRFDAMMDRTADRPIPSGRITKTDALIFILITFITGSLLLIEGANATAMLLGWLTFFWYNAIYTPLKRISVFAVIIGAVIGALPPMIGYAAAGGLWYDFDSLLVAFFFFIWQVPHFILLVIRHGKDYEKAGYPSLSKRFSREQISRIVFIWIVGTVLSALLLPIYNVVTNPVLIVVLLGLSISLIFTARKLISITPTEVPFKRIFMNINFYLLGVMIILSLQSFV